ncbi:Rossmann-fold NAD(P)-binding domain-containing protein [Streptomyces sp. NPDC001714]|uniref:hypothetical protein n=1 Tax=Streptomyces sp. NPDC001714 TaxID=3364603 RepID=UPI00368ADD4F
MSLMSLGVLASSRKENEFRLPLHPAHLNRIAPDVRGRIFQEQGYGERFGVADDTSRLYAFTAAGALPLAEYLAGFDIIVNCVFAEPGRQPWGSSDDAEAEGLFVQMQRASSVSTMWPTWMCLPEKGPAQSGPLRGLQPWRPRSGPGLVDP